MHQKERIDYIYNILKENGYVTVKYLTEELDYSTATINRDLNIMQARKLVKRSYGGVEILKQKNVPLVFRYHKMKAAKNKICKTAADFISDGDTVFIDGSTTTQYMAKFLTKKKNITVITNNIALVTFLSEYNIDVICLGGKVVEIPYILSGADTIENARKYHADKLFFSTTSITDSGKIGFDADLFYLLNKTMLENSDKIFCMSDHEKLNVSCKKYLCDFSDIDCMISDFDFSDTLTRKFSNCEFININN